ncbi:MAG: DUF4454 domain-containing protein, partial [Lachnospiraceae bacterium]|nr:DUF4454 domain-containing protein [Lachnospiraceae bacterium]
EAVFCPLEMSNLELLQKAEADFDEKKAAEAKKAYEKLPETPYRGLLPDHGEIQVTIAANGTDQGIFYESEGTISLPVEVLPEQYEAVMKEFGEAEICVNERTGETAVMKISENTDHGDCTLVYDSGLELGYYLSYDPYPGTYSLWANSADTLFKPVYEGSIYVLKGAEKGWSGYFQLPPEERFLEDGGWRKMDFTGEDSGESETYSGNVPAFDEKGYLRGLYYYGD